MMGFPTEMLNRIQHETFIYILENDTTGITPTEAEFLAAQERMQLERFTWVMSHIYVFSDW
jgi:hypothetical protein